nr:MAG TPA: hypothetical protein [Caudoviricetes sp.]
MLGTKIYKNNFNDELYKQCAEWCNENNQAIEDKGEFYEVVKFDGADLERKFKKMNLENEIKAINFKISELRGVSECAVNVDGNNEYDVIIDGELVVMNDTEFQNYFDELTNKRSELLQQYKELK